MLILVIRTFIANVNGVSKVVQLVDASDLEILRVVDQFVSLFQMISKV